jgi:hypothetical protein
MKTNSWCITNLTRKTDTGVVTHAEWRLDVSETRGEEEETETKMSSAIGIQQLSEVDPEDPAFVPYESLTEEQVVTWVKDALGTDVEAIEAKLANEVDEAFQPIILTGKPW